MSLPYFPMFPSDFEAKTSHLSILEDGAYNRLLRICWMTPGCSLPEDEAWIMRRARAHSEAEKEAVRAVLAEFFRTTGGRLSNARLTKEWKAANEAHEKRKNAGSKGGKAKSLKTNDPDPSNTVAMPKQPEPEPEPYEVATASSSAQQQREASPGPDLVDDVMAAVGLTSGKIPTHWLPPGSMMHVTRWVTDLGLTPAEIIAAARSSRQQHTSPPNGPKALDGVMHSLAKAKAAGRMVAATDPRGEAVPTIPRASPVPPDGAVIPSESFPDTLPPADPKFATS